MVDAGQEMSFLPISIKRLIRLVLSTIVKRTASTRPPPQATQRFSSFFGVRRL
jgi:hypothetical protein